MTWLHNETSGRIKRLVNNNGKSSYQDISGTITGHFKQVSLEDGSFDVSNISGEAYKFTIKQKVDVKESDRLIIETGEFAGEYSIKAVKFGNGIKLKTTKILCLK